jgi:ABC-2 type transport system ATP-binding protein
MGAEVAVVLNKLERRFGDFVAVVGLTLEVSRGEIFGFLGPNGAGKSTTIRMLCGLLEPTSGTGTVAGYDIRSERPAIRQHIGYMSQKFSLYEDLTVDENVAFFGGVYGLSGRRLAERGATALGDAGLSGQRRALVRDLPLGFKQRLALACAVLHEPPILFLDEPTSGVDPLARRRFWELIHALAERGVTIFVTTHYMEEAEYCGRLALIDRGEMIALGTPEELKHARLADVILEVVCPDPGGAASSLAGLVGVREVALFGRGLHVVVASERAKEAQAAILGALDAAGQADARVARVEPSMDDVFVSLVEARSRNGAS